MNKCSYEIWGGQRFDGWLSPRRSPGRGRRCSWASGRTGLRAAAAGLALGLLSLLGLGTRVLAQADPAGLEFFENRIRPQLVKHCYACHSAEAKKVTGGLRLDTRENLLKGGDSGPALVLGDPERSLLIQAVRHAKKDLAMPRSKDGSSKLPETVVQDLVRWVQMGAPYPVTKVSDQKSSGSTASHWSFQPIQDPPEPAVRNAAWPRTSLDPFILAKLEARGLQPAPAADRRTLIRRVTFDVIGLPPTPEEIEAFLADPAPDAWARVVERLLNSPHYGERWGRHWLDVVRYADTAGDTADYPVPVAWRYRNYVIDAFNADKPYDEFLREQIAGDILARQGPRERYAERVTATGYLAISRRFGFDSENYHHLTIQDTIDTLGQSVLGLSLGCARCHNHKFDPVSSTEYYGLYGIFDSTRYSFPGSEQKSRYRALVPLASAEESGPKWRELEARFAGLGISPGAVLRSLDDLDGDFEMQHIAAGGSNGVLVPPWLYEGPISVTQEAQSPFKNLHPFGIVGASVAAGTNRYQIEQRLHPSRSRGLLHVNLDFRVATNAPSALAPHRFWIGAQPSAPAVEVLLSSSAVTLRAGGREQVVRALKPAPWRNLQLILDLEAGTVVGSVGVPGEVALFSKQLLSPAWGNALNFIAFDALSSSNAPRPGLEIDNVGVQESPIPPVSTSAPSALASASSSNLPALTAQLRTLVGLDGDFELQEDGQPPALPWHPGPNSAVKISAASQSPYRNLFPSGRLGLRLPNSGAYNGFGQILTNLWKADQTGRLFASFDFRGASEEAGGAGSWRFHIGHGSASTAVELGFNDREFFRRSGDARSSVRALRRGEWYQVQLVLNLQERHYTGSIATLVERTAFSGQFPSGWDGSIDYTFIDSGGHLAGVKPTLDVDNFVIGEIGLPALDGPPRERAGDPRLAGMGELRRQIAQLEGDTEKRKQELNAMLAEGPLPLAYGVAEGTPHNARLQMRGEPDKPGEEVPRGFLKILGGGLFPPETSGSGRLELAQWLTRPENPLTARVLVNRLWQYHFGQGLVNTPNDFGKRGQPPTHPELLDHLATRFIQGGWSIKAMHRLLLSSATYQQASPAAVPGAPGAGVSESNLSPAAVPAPSGVASMNTNDASSPHPIPGLGVSGRGVGIEAVASDYAFFQRRRLTAEELRDSILRVSGELDPTPGRGHPFPAATSWGYSQHGPFSAVYEHRQRSVYLMTQRLKRHPFLALFDGADPNTSTPDRRGTTVPTQALYFLNDPFVHAQAEKFAARLGGAGGDETRRVELAYRWALGRLPREVERREAAEFLAAYRSELSAARPDQIETAAWSAFARVLFGSNEFLSID